MANLVTLPLAMLDQVGDLASRLAPPSPAVNGRPPLRIPNSIDDLSDRDPFVRAAAPLRIGAQVRYHSIIGREQPDGDLARS